MESKLIFRHEYRFDLKKVESVLLPPLFDENDFSLVFNIKYTQKNLPRFIVAGMVNQILIDYPYRLIASTQQILLNENYQLIFPQQGRFQVEFIPQNFLGKTIVSVSRIILP